MVQKITVNYSQDKQVSIFKKHLSKLSNNIQPLQNRPLFEEDISFKKHFNAHFEFLDSKAIYNWVQEWWEY